ncbi:diguanylate cyclase [Achromobacter sp. UMC46]|uniref:GGDEF domain-containing protein n=1 Tax=Achromobacter sp. UMC46 TaxID=1862319 RepID=UPI0021034A17|nr:sensor domain-containing diguanylate cyclase [Achromobacter sp. UMC46]MBB1593129.1 diguanylate cyclase [Achromobacter sp. UMC46]
MKRKVSLFTVLIALAVLSVAIGFFNALYAGYQVQKAQVVKNSLASNVAYAEKLAEFINLYIDALHRQLKISAARLPDAQGTPQALTAELSRVASQAQGVTAVLLADAGGTIIARSAQAPAQLAAFNTLAELGMKGQRPADWVVPCCEHDGQRAALMLVEPVPGKDGTAAGFLAAVVILERGSRLDRLIGEHPYGDGASVYLVNVDGRVLYSHAAGGPDESVLSLVKADVSPTSGPGSAQVSDASGAPVLAGYAPITKGKWAVVIQRPLDLALSPLKTLLAESLRFAIPAVIVTLLLVCGLAYAIARPLARLTRAMGSPEAIDKQGPRASLLKTWYFEADKLREALIATLAQHRHEVGRLNTQTMTDPMTGLMNRRALELRFDELAAAVTPFAVIALDLDHFKQVNDVFGHPVGDKVLILLAKTLSDSVRQQDRPFRVGGEEFVVIVPASSPEVAMHAAERIRADVAKKAMPDGVGHATVSVGVALWPQHGKSPQAVVKCADEALYASKAAGRNRVTLWKEGLPQ